MSNIAKIRGALVMAQTFAKQRILFVPMPCESAEEHARLVTEAWKKLDEMEASAEEKH